MKELEGHSSITNIGNTDQVHMEMDQSDQPDSPWISSTAKAEYATEQTSVDSHSDSAYHTARQLSPPSMLVDSEAKRDPLEDDSELPSHDGCQPASSNRVDVPHLKPFTAEIPDPRPRTLRRAQPSPLRHGSTPGGSSPPGLGSTDDDMDSRLSKRRKLARTGDFAASEHSASPTAAKAREPVTPSRAGSSSRRAEPLIKSKDQSGVEGRPEPDDGYLRLKIPAASKASGSGDTRIKGDGYHPYRFELRPVVATNEDFEQDRGKNTFSIDAIPANFPLFHLRYGKKPPSNLYPRLNAIEPSGASAPGSRSAEGSNQETPTKTYSGPAGRGDTALKDENAIMATALSRFDSRFIDLIPPKEKEFEQSLEDTAKWLRDLPPQLRTFLSKHPKKNLPPAAHSFAGTSSPHEDKVSVACAALLQALSDQLLRRVNIEPVESTSWVACGTRELLPAKSTPKRSSGKEPSSKPDQALKSAPMLESATVPIDEGTSEGKKRKRADRKDKITSLTHDEVLVLLEPKKPVLIESKVWSENPHDRIVPRIVRYGLNTTVNNAIAGRVTVISVAGTLIRLWFIDAFSVATTRVWDLALPEHAYEIVKMVAFLLGPIQDVLQTWKPPLEGFTTRLPVPQADNSSDESKKATSKSSGDQEVARDDAKTAADPADGVTHDEGSSTQLRRGHEHVETKHWEWVDKKYDELWWQEKHLFGRRTTLWVGEIRQAGVHRAAEREAIATAHDDPAAEQTALNCVIKATFLPPGLVVHEHEMLMRLDPAVPLPENSEFAKLDAKIKDEVVQNLPRSLGLVDLEKSSLRATRKLPATADVEYNHQNPLNLTHLELVVLAMQGPVGKEIEPRFDNLTLADVCEIHQGPFLQLWYGAEKGVHFRDVSPGNILYKRLPDGRKVGFLIDYGNARFENERRDKSTPADMGKGVCEDDLRSGTPQFLCVAVLESAAIIAKCSEIEAAIAKDVKGDDREALEGELASLEEKLLVSRHRFMDDLETWLYNLLFHVSTTTDVPETAYGTVKSTLHDPALKKTGWTTRLSKMAHSSSNDRFADMVKHLARVVSRIRKDIEGIMAKPDLPKRPTTAELMAYPELWEIFLTGCEDLRAQQIEKDAAASSA